VTTSDDPFERAARHEQQAWLQREVLAARHRAGTTDSRQVLVAIVVFAGPYALWAALRAANHSWGPSIGHALTNFFFGSGAWFATYTAWLLFLMWVWVISALNYGRRAHSKVDPS
jgi:hypothetical protein